MKKQKRSDTARTAMLAGELRVLLGALRRRLREDVRSGDFTLSQLLVISLLEREGPTTVTVLARAEGMRPQSMGAIVSSLESAGFVSGAPDPTDGRQTILSLTMAGRQWIKDNRAAREDWLFRAIRTNLTSTEQESLAVGVELLKRLVER
jgi:DNA-binding MarR family transcriptional regulator